MTTAQKMSVSTLENLVYWNSNEQRASGKINLTSFEYVAEYDIIDLYHEYALRSLLFERSFLLL